MLQELYRPEFWKTIRENPDYAEFITCLKERCEEARELAFSTLRYTVRKIYYQTGSRGEFEVPYFARRTFVSTAALLALIYPEEHRYLDDTQDMIWEICCEQNWMLPAHVDNDLYANKTITDLFSAETAFCLAEICAVLGDRLDPVARDFAKESILTKVLLPFCERKHWWEDLDNNWISVCTGSIAGAMLYVAPELFEQQKERIYHNLEQYLSGFPADGTCLEGHSYWVYGFSYYCTIAELILRHTDGAVDLMESEKVLNIACYMQRNFLKGDATVSFSDGTRSGTANLGLQHYLHRRFPNHVRILPQHLMSFSGCNVNWYLYARTFLYYDPTAKSELPLSEDLYLPEAQHMIVNRKRYSFAIKAGHNDESHNHNDIGSFLISDKSGQVFCDLGAGRYTREYFQPAHRYEYFCNSSFGHSVPIIGGIGQKEGRAFCGKLQYKDGVVTVEMAGAYDIPKLRQLTRTVRFEEDRVSLTDSIDAGDLDVTERFVTLIEPEVSADHITVGGVTLLFDAGLTPKITIQPFDVHKNSQAAAPPIPVYCIDFAIPKEQSSPEFVFVIQ